ncbi:MAG: hypothetical protein DRN54_04685 [Thaumarchaeota archaeon]|nr:MAG: hypothetical protein DRN54_04685 [Nitrososphaerota archaeon]
MNEKLILFNDKLTFLNVETNEFNYITVISSDGVRKEYADSTLQLSLHRLMQGISEEKSQIGSRREGISKAMRQARRL